MSIKPAGVIDIPDLVKLVNSAYRGESSKKGWTTEADLLAGDLRTDDSTLSSMMNSPGSAILKYTNDTGVIEGCVYLQKRGDRLYLGMLSVSPVLQSSGIGKKLMTAAHDYAQAQNCRSIFMRVISVRPELIAWYERRGYYLTGETEPLPNDPRFGIPTQPLEFVIMEKKITV
jgi:ribosomal protein S18 acetylase RimI-like enzyme